MCVCECENRVLHFCVSGEEAVDWEKGSSNFERNYSTKTHNRNNQTKMRDKYKKYGTKD